MDISLNRVFTNRELNSLVKTGTMHHAEIVNKKYDLDAKNLKDMFKLIYEYLVSKHRNEYYYNAWC